MKERIVKRLSALSDNMENLIKERELHASSLRRLDRRIAEITAVIVELKELVEEEDEQRKDPKQD